MQQFLQLGSLEKGTEVFANVDFDRYESWKLKLNQAPEKNKKPQPMFMNVAWQNRSCYAIYRLVK
jgi:translocation and assembly module TamB